jgi:hypothetical protein
MPVKKYLTEEERRNAEKERKLRYYYKKISTEEGKKEWREKHKTYMREYYKNKMAIGRT